MEEQAIELPEMPVGAAHKWGGEWPEFSKEDMERFGRACVLAERERNALDAARYRALFSIESFCCDPLWPVVDWFRGNDVSKTEVDAALDAAISKG
jgi:hypothetical protein